MALPLLAALAAVSALADMLGLLLEVWLGSCAILPVLALAAFAAAFPTARLSLRRRLTIAGLIALLVSVPLTHWPLRLMFECHRDALDRRSDLEFASEGPPVGPISVGLLRFIAVRERPERPSIGFQLTGDAGGGTYLVRAKPGAKAIWNNINWEVDLGDGWWMVHND